MRLRFATYLAPSVEPMYRWVAERCGATDFLVGRDWRELAGDEIDVAFVCSPPLVWLAGSMEALAAPVLAGARFGGRPVYFSDVVVHRQAPHRSLTDLRGARWAYNEPGSWSGFWSGLAEVHDWSFFGEVVGAGFHARALRLVAEGRIDGAAIDCQVLALESMRHPALASRLRVVASLGPWPIQPVAVRSRLAVTVRHRLFQQLLTLRGPELERFGVSGFSAPPDCAAIAERLPCPAGR